MKRFQFLSFFLLLVALTPVRAENMLATQAYEHGHFDIAYKEFSSNSVEDAQAQYYLGRMFERGEGVGVNYHRAVRWYFKAADAGYVDAEAALGNLFTGGGAEQFPKNYREAARWLTKAAEHGHAEAAARLGDFYLTGRGGKKDVALGVAWLQESLSRGNAQAKQQLEQLKGRLPPSVFEQANNIQPALLNNGQGSHE